MSSSIGDTLNEWMGTGEAASRPRQRAHELAAELRGVAEAITLLDPEAADEDDLAALVQLAADLRSGIGALPDLSAHGSAARAPVPASLLHERSPVSGHVNPVSIPLTFEYHDDKVIARAVFGRQFEGPADGVHGGFVAAAFDELLGVAQMLSGMAGYTAGLTLHYRAITPIGRQIVHESGVLDNDGRKLRMWARSTCDDDLLVEAEGLFVVQRHLPIPIGPDGRPRGPGAIDGDHADNVTWVP